MSGNNGRKFTINRQQTRTQPREDFAAVFAGSFSSQPAIPMDIPVAAIEPSPYQARLAFADLEELAESIRMHGFTSRIRVRPHPTQPERYQMVYGERRLRAAKLAGLQIIPCDVAQHSDADLREIGLIENLQRQDLSALEEARAFRLMLDENGYSMRSLGERIGKSKGYIQNKLDLLRAPADVQQMVNTQADTQSAALIIAQLPSEEQRRPLIEGVMSGTLDTKMVRDMVSTLQESHATALHEQNVQHGEGTTHKRTRGTGNNRPAARMAATGGRADNHSDGASTELQARRQARQSGRALAQAIQTLRAMTAQLRESTEQLQPAERSALLDYVIHKHFPMIEELVEELRL